MSKTSKQNYFIKLPFFFFNSISSRKVFLVFSLAVTEKKNRIIPSKGTNSIRTKSQWLSKFSNTPKMASALFCVAFHHPYPFHPNRVYQMPRLSAEQEVKELNAGQDRRTLCIRMLCLTELAG